MTTMQIAVTIANDQWTYNPPSPWHITQSTTQIFTLSQPGYSFVGIAFNNPNRAFSGGLVGYSISNVASSTQPGQIGTSTLTLTDLDTATANYSFRFLVSAPGGALLISPDPQDQDTVEPPPP